jgi:SmpA / OmlA family
MKHAALGLLLATLVGGCVHGSALEQVRPGMTREEVTALMGPPEGSTNTAGRECVLYTVAKDFWSRTPWSMTDRYEVCYADGRVETFGLAQS